MRKYISEESEDREHHDERRPDPDIPPRDKPEGSECDRGGKCSDSPPVKGGRGVWLLLTEKCNIYTRDDP